MLEDPATLDKEPFPDPPATSYRSNVQVVQSISDVPETSEIRILNPRPQPTTALGNPAPNRPKALGYLRTDISGPHAPRHTAALHRHARTLGYQYVYTIHPPEHLDDPLAYALGIATALAVETLIVYDLSHVDDQPAPACATVNLETVCPPTTWARTVPTPAGHPERMSRSFH